MNYLLKTVLWKTIKRPYLLASLDGFSASVRSYVDSECLISEHTSIHGNASLSNVSLGKFSYVTSSKLIHVNVGMFCSIGPGSTIGGLAPHPYHYISTSPVLYSNGLELKNTFCNKEIIDNYPKLVDIGNDVWIGANVLIMPGVNIGHGAVIGAGSVVVKDVEPYSIIAGVPAKSIKKRFENDIIDKLLDKQWWNWDERFFIDHPCVLATSDFNSVLSEYEKWTEK